MSYALERIPEVSLNLGDFEKVCALTVALKISDDSCKMDAYEKSIFMALYDALLPHTSGFFNNDVFDVISSARHNPSAKVFAEVKALRESAMEMISRPKMKAFKASIRARIS